MMYDGTMAPWYTIRVASQGANAGQERMQDLIIMVVFCTASLSVNSCRTK